MTNIKLSGYVRDLTGSALDTAVVERFDRNDTTTVLETATLSGGKWTFDVTPQNDNTDRFDVRATVGTEQTFLHYDDEVQLTTLETANFRIRTPTGAQANKWVYDIVGAVITADRTLKLPLITTTDTLATLGLAATFSAIMTHSADIILQDDVDLALGTSSDALMRWSDGDADNHALVLALGNDNEVLHITNVADVATDWNVSANAADAEVWIHSDTTPATDYLRIGGHDGTTAYIDLAGGTNLDFQIDGTSEMEMTAAILAPAVSDGLALGSTSLMWSDLFLANGAVINFNNGEQTITDGGSANMTITGTTTLNYTTNNAGANTSLLVRNHSTTAGSTMVITASTSGSASGAADPRISVSTDGGASFMMAINNDASDIFSLTRGSTAGTDDGLRMTNASPPVITYNTTHPTGTFDYVCEECGRHEAEEFTCCGEVKWHNDVEDFRALALKKPGALEYMQKVGVMQKTFNNRGLTENFTVLGQDWLFAASMAMQVYDRMNAQYDALDKRVAKLGV
jgi:hypothetical protein